jgi:hypothetical protein
MYTNRVDEGKTPAAPAVTIRHPRPVRKACAQP